MPKDKVDGIWARASLHHLNELQLIKLFIKIANYSQAGLVVGMVNKYGNSEEFEEKQKYGHLLKRYFNYFSEEKVRKLADQHGYEMLKQYQRQVDEHSFLISFLRLQR